MRVKWVKQLVSLFIVATVLYQTGRQLFRQQEWEARNYLYDQVKTAFPDANKKAAAEYGIRVYSGGQVGETATAFLSTPMVVLVHGLDEPGRVWQNLAPVLDTAGYKVLLMTYPNDQRVTASSRLFFESLAGLDFSAEKHLVIIAHSMGGLVSREMLTSPNINYKRSETAGKVPRVSNLIMVGTPNHGSQLARFRFIMEIREQARNLFEKDGHWLQGLWDGTGAAGLDLIPGSRFLNRLNHRPHPVNVNFHIIAGILSPWNSQDIRTFASFLEALMPLSKNDGVRGVENGLNKVKNMVGDGLVTLESARLDKVPLTRVHGNHLTMIRNLTLNSQRVPPAIPVILGILGHK